MPDARHVKVFVLVTLTWLICTPPITATTYMEARIESNLVVAGGKLFFVQPGGSLTVLDVETGEVLKRFDLGGAHGIVATDYGIVLLSSRRFVVLDLDQLEVLWEQGRQGGCHFSEDVVICGRPESTDPGPRAVFTARSIRDGTFLWPRRVNIDEEGEVLSSRKRLLIASERVHREERTSEGASGAILRYQATTRTVQSFMLLDLDSGKTLLEESLPPEARFELIAFDGDTLLLRSTVPQAHACKGLLWRVLEVDEPGRAVSSRDVCDTRPPTGETASASDGRWPPEIELEEESLTLRGDGAVPSPSDRDSLAREASVKIGGGLLMPEGSAAPWLVLLPQESGLSAREVWEIGGRLFVESRAQRLGTLDCVDLATGRPLWKYVYPAFAQLASTHGFFNWTGYWAEEKAKSSKVWAGLMLAPFPPSVLLPSVASVQELLARRPDLLEYISMMRSPHYRNSPTVHDAIESLQDAITEHASSSAAGFPESHIVFDPDPFFKPSAKSYAWLALLIAGSLLVLWRWRHQAVRVLAVVVLVGASWGLVQRLSLGQRASPDLRSALMRSIPEPHKHDLRWAATLGRVDLVRTLLERQSEQERTESEPMLADLLALGVLRDQPVIVRAMLDAGVDPNVRGYRGRTALAAAASSGQLEMIQLLLARGARVDATDDLGDSPLLLALREGHAELARIFRAQGAAAPRKRELAHSLFSASSQGDVQQVKNWLARGARADTALPCAFGESPLFVAARNGHAEVVDVLIGNGAEVDQTDDLRSTPLQAAARQGHAAVVELLLTACANAQRVLRGSAMDRVIQEAAEKQRSLGQELLSAAKDGKNSLSNTLIQRCADVNASTEGRATALMWAVGRGDGNMVRQLLAAGANVDAVTDERVTALSLAYDTGRVEMIDILLDADARPREDLNLASPTARDREQTLAYLLDPDFPRRSETLVLAALHGEAAEVSELLREGARVNLRSGYGTALTGAAAKGHLRTAEILLKAGARLDIPTVSGSTPLARAVMSGRSEIVVLLLEHGADANERVPHSWPVLFSAAKRGNAAMVRALLRKGAQVNEGYQGLTALRLAVDGGHTEVVDLLLRHGADVNTVDRNGAAPLSSAILRGNSEIIEMLLSHGADDTSIHILTKGRMTPLMVAAKAGRVAEVSRLLAAGADLSAVNPWGTTALMWATLQGHADVVRLLLEKGADPIAQDLNGETSLDIAKVLGYQDVQAILESAARDR